MTPRDIREDLEPGIGEDVIALAERLREARPLPSASFRGELGRRFVGRPQRLLSRARARSVVAACSASGTLLLAIGAVGASGHGPFG
jgi:hypothetical protein